MTTWQSIPTLVGNGAESVRRFAQDIGLTESGLRQSDWETIPYFPPPAPSDQSFAWEQQTYGLYRIRTTEKQLWLFWFAIKDWRKGEFLPFEPQVVVHWQQPDSLMITQCAYRFCLNPALLWPSPALSMIVQVHGQRYSLDFYGCSDAHHAVLSSAEECTLEFQTSEQEQIPRSILARQVIHISPAQREQAHKISTRPGRVAGCSYDQWIIEIPGLWQPEEIESIETTLRARLQEHFDHFQEHNGGLWRLSVSYNHRRFVALHGGNTFEAPTAQALADAITQDYAALRHYW